MLAAPISSVEKCAPANQCGVDSAVLVDVERAVHVSLHLGVDSGEPDAVGRRVFRGNRRLFGRPKLAKTLPKALPTDSWPRSDRLGADPQPRRRSDWMQRDRALILTALLAGLRADELLRADVGDLRRTDDGAVVYVRRGAGRPRGSGSMP